MADTNCAIHKSVAFRRKKSGAGEVTGGLFCLCALRELRVPCRLYTESLVRARHPLKIDLHTHIIPESWPDLAEKYGYSGFVRLDHHQPCRAKMMVGDRFFREIEDNCWNPGRRLEDCEKAAVDVQVLSTIPVMFSYWAQPKDTLDLSQFLNDHLAGVVREHPDRFVGLGTVPMQDPDLACQELERCVTELGMAGIEIGTHINDWNLDERALFPIFECASRLGASVFVHPWDMMAKEKMPNYFLPWLVGMPAETSLAICSMMFGGVFDSFPNLRTCFAHGGGAFPYTLARIEQGYACRPDLTQVNQCKPPRAYLDSFYVDSLVQDADTLRFLMHVMGGADRVALGSDYPFPLGEIPPGRVIDGMTDLSDADRERLLSGTALEFLGLERSAFRGGSA